MSFAHLEVHSHFTLLGATPGVGELAARASEEGLTHLALTDTNALYGAVAFDRTCRATGVQSIIGMAVTVADPRSKTAPPESASAETGPGRLVLLATGPTGYRSLCGLSTAIQGQAERAAVAASGIGWDLLSAYCAGLICLSGGRRGWIERYLRQGERSAAQEYAGRLAGLYDENAVLALELHTPPDRQVAQEVSAIARRLGLQAAAVQPIYCLQASDRPRLRLLTAIGCNCPLADVPVAALADGGDATVSLHWLDAADLQRRYQDLPWALDAAGEIASRCRSALPAGQTLWPAYPLPAGQDPDAALAEAARRGLTAHYGEPARPPSEQQASPGMSPVAGQAAGAEAPIAGFPNPRSEAPANRLDRELAAIAEHGYAPLFLVVADAVAYAREQSIPVSTRGSVANSLVAYCVGITTVDPLAHGLLFERFLSPARADPPDIDLDFCSRRRDEVLEYVRQRYGAAHVAIVGTISTLRPQGAVHEVGKVMGLTDAEIERIMPLLPRDHHPDPRRHEHKTAADVVAALSDAPALQQVVEQAFGIVGQPDHLSMHPGGVVITPCPLTDVLPLQWAPKGFLVTQYEHGDVELLGLPKIDMLGIRALTVLADATALVQRHYEPTFRLDAVPLDDPATSHMLERGDTIGVFQCESDGAQRTLRKLRARTIADLAIANAFFKPGPSTGGMATAFVRRYRGQERVNYLHPSLAPILGATKGVLIFQEQILRVAREIAGLSWAQADHLRRGMSKFRAAEMDELRQQFISGCQRPPPDGPGFSPTQAATLWDQVAAFAGYGFNQGHATAYADVSFRSAYLKTHWPAAFLAARMADRGGFHHPVIYMVEARRLGIPVFPPHVNQSGAAFTLVPRQGLYMGLGQVRDLRDTAVLAIVAGRRRRKYTGLTDLLERVELRPREVQHLIQCGALDGLGASRAALLAEAGQQKSGGGQLSFAFAEPAAPPESPAERLAWEQRILGWPVSVHPLSLVADRLPPHLSLRRVAATPGRPVTTVGVRLPGWTGGHGFFLGDQEIFVIAKPPDTIKAPPIWRPVVITGRWTGDSFGDFWLAVEDMVVVANPA